MTLEELLHSASFIINQLIPNLKFGFDRYNLALKLVNYDYFKQWTGLPEDWQPGQPVSRRGWQVARENTDALRIFIVPNQNYVVDAYGQLVYPSGFVSLSRLGYYNSTTSRQRPIEELMDSEVDDRLGNPVTAPEKEYPVVIYYNTYLQFYPVDLQNVNMSYLRLPATPVYAIKQEHGIDVYDSASSTQLEWPERFHSDILRMLIGYLAPGLKDVNLANFIETKKVQGV